ncbi:MAG: hypothetical protein WCG25_08335 [bacterium]
MICIATILQINLLVSSHTNHLASLHKITFFCCIASPKLNADFGCHIIFLTYVPVVKGQNFACINGIISAFSLSHIFLYVLFHRAAIIGFFTFLILLSAKASSVNNLIISISVHHSGCSISKKHALRK